MPYNAPVIFPEAWDFWKARSYSYTGKAWQKVNMTAEGIIGGKVAATHRRMPSRRSTKLRLYADERGQQLVADGSDFVVVVCEVTDDSGNVRRMAKEQIRFTVEGEGSIIGDGTDIGANPRQVEWGSAPVLVRSTRHAGEIRLHAEVLYPGTHAPVSADLVLHSVPSPLPLVADTAISPSQRQQTSLSASSPSSPAAPSLSEEEKQRMLKEVQEQQADFGVK